ncbi:ribosome-associated heat shock protein Hsp15 [Agromyces cerinus]|uniref:Ribosome-associated heat shock protein Hsp15 n=2 Tax=Agromyces TaxID=33877 RepID=A0A852WTR7_9MICO|nr:MULTISPECIES: S4 domain-containing protein [Agromyces]MBM7830800.1 ribosome-associated heat shock protein Hsp15 [Agromyces cerinus]NYG19690.1 ribosome-associated heat shock protein Hsp15 [Agromyces hippuratus]SIN78671.1 heat shock protein Hsp15 [Agromyces cerinus subsp. cerinus]
MNGESPVRVDAWLWAVRQFKTRSSATAACRAGHVRVNGERAKAAQSVRPGDEVRVRIDGFDRMLVVRQTLVKRVSAAVAATAVDDRTPPPPPRETVAIVATRDRGAGRPTKRERRDLERLRGR